MKGWATITGALLVVYAGSITPLALARHFRPSRCLSQNAKTIGEDRAVRIYTIPPRFGANGGLTRREHTYACAVRSGRAVLLQGNGNQVHSVEPIALSGDFVAYADYQHGIDTGCTIIGVVDVVTATTYLKLPAGCAFLTEGSLVTDLVVDERGCVAWITSGRLDRQQIFQVRMTSASGDGGLLDSGTQIAPRSLSLAPEGNISWLSAGSPQYWELPYHDCVAPVTPKSN